MTRPDRRPEAGGWRAAALWFGLLGGAAAWTAHLLLAYLIAEFGCERGLDRHARLGIALPTWLLLAQSAVMLAIASAATLAALRLRRLAPRPRGDAESHHASPRQLRQQEERRLAGIGAIASGLFTFITLIQSIPIFFYLQGC